VNGSPNRINSIGRILISYFVPNKNHYNCNHMYQFQKLQFYRYHSFKLWINILMLCLHAHILLESQHLNWETKMLRTLQVESNSTNTQCSTLTRPMFYMQSIVCYQVTKQEMHIVTKFGMPVVCYQVWNPCY